MNQIAKLMLVLCLLSALGLAQTTVPASTQERPSSATVKIAIVDGWGMTLADSVLRSFKDEPGQDWRGAFLGNQASRIPFGSYLLIAGAYGFEDAEVKLEIRSAEVLVKIGLD